LGML